MLWILLFNNVRLRARSGSLTFIKVTFWLRSYYTVVIKYIRIRYQFIAMRFIFYVFFCFSFCEYWRHGRCCRRKYNSEDSVLYVRSGLGQSLFIPVRDKKTNPPPRFRLKCPTFWNSNALPTWSASLFYFFCFHFALRQTDKLYLPRHPSCAGKAFPCRRVTNVQLLSAAAIYRYRV